jgi:shikimate kinase
MNKISFQVLIHDHSELPLVRELGIKVSSTFATTVAIASKKVSNIVESFEATRSAANVSFGN